MEIYTSNNDFILTSGIFLIFSLQSLKYVNDITPTKEKNGTRLL